VPSTHSPLLPPPDTGVNEAPLAVGGEKIESTAPQSQ
jgi:hypothetical protein